MYDGMRWDKMGWDGMGGDGIHIVLGFRNWAGADCTMGWDGSG